MPESLFEGIKRELARNRKLLIMYITRTNSAAVITERICAAEAALRDQDVIAMLEAFKDLEKSE